MKGNPVILFVKNSRNKLLRIYRLQVLIIILIMKYIFKKYSFAFMPVENETKFII